MSTRWWKKARLNGVSPEWIQNTPNREIQIRDDRIAELEADLRKTALDYLAADWQAAEAYQAQLAAEARIEELEKENFTLAATQCPFPDGEGLTGSPSGYSYCAKDVELEGCDEYIQSLIKTIEEVDGQIEELEAKLEAAEKIGFDEREHRYGITSYNDWWQDRYKRLAQLKGDKGWTKELMGAIEDDGEYLRQMTGEDHGPYFFDAAGCIECGAHLPSPSDAVCITCLQSAADKIAEHKGEK